MEGYWGQNQQFSWVHLQLHVQRPISHGCEPISTVQTPFDPKFISLRHVGSFVPLKNQGWIQAENCPTLPTESGPGADPVAHLFSLKNASFDAQLKVSKIKSHRIL